MSAVPLREDISSEDLRRLARREKDIRDLAERRYGARYSVSGMHRLLKSLDLSWMTARPQHPQADPAAQEAFKKSSRS